MYLNLHHFHYFSHLDLALKWLPLRLLPSKQYKSNWQWNSQMMNRFYKRSCRWNKRCTACKNKRPAVCRYRRSLRAPVVTEVSQILDTIRSFSLSPPLSLHCRRFKIGICIHIPEDDLKEMDKSLKLFGKPKAAAKY